MLEVGAGPGRFTTVLAELGARIVVTDFSPVQLELNRTHVGCAPAEDAVARRELLDVCDTSRYGDGELDVAVADGGPLSYAFEQTEDALRGLRRITGPNGVVVASVTSMLGSWRHLLCDVTTVAARIGEDANDAVLRTGDLRPPGLSTSANCSARARSRTLPRAAVSESWLLARATGRRSAISSRFTRSNPTPTGGDDSWTTRSPRAPSRARSTAAPTSCSPSDSARRTDVLTQGVARRLWPR